MDGAVDENSSMLLRRLDLCQLKASLNSCFIGPNSVPLQ